MDTKRMQSAAQWLHDTVFQDEAIRPRAVTKTEQLPALILSARSLENGKYQSWQSPASVFMKQGKLLADYEDDYAYDGGCKCYYPTYQALTNRELRGYFSWRTRLRRGEGCEGPLSFAFLYIYELLNQIGAADPLDGYHKLISFRDAYGAQNGSILRYLQQWLVDYVAYYGLDAALLSDAPPLLREQGIAVLEDIAARDTAEVMNAVRALSGWLARSRFYAENRQDLDRVIVRVLGRMSAHYASRCKKSLTEQYFGVLEEMPVMLFESAVFCNPLGRRSYAYTVSGHFTYRCENGGWYVQKHYAHSRSSGGLDALLKTIESVMRRQVGYRYPLKPQVKHKWVLRIIEEEIEQLLAQKKAAEERKVTIRYAQLDRIRQDAAFTQERLMVEEERADWPMGPPLPAASQRAPAPETSPLQQVPGSELPPSQGVPAPGLPPSLQASASSLVPPEPAGQEEVPLSPPEYRLLQCLLYGGDTGWVQAQGHLLSVLVDGINDKLYERFQDTVLDGDARPLEDYMEDLKGMIRP